MRILWLYQYDPDYNFDSWFHLDYVRWMRNHGVDVVAYGPRLEEAYADIAPIPFDRSRSLRGLHAELHFDVVVANTKSRLFFNYEPRQTTNENCWLPRDFSSLSCPKVMIEEDYQYEDDDAWYEHVGFSLMLQRHYSNSLRPHLLPVRWFPFSVDTDTFTPLTDEAERIEKIAFFGHKAHEIYVDRRWACQQLGAAGLLAEYSEGRIITGIRYPSLMRRYTAVVVGSGIYNMTFAKYLEIAASGAAILTNTQPGYGIEHLFRERCYFTYHNDCSDIIPAAQRVLAFPETTRHVAQVARKAVVERHSHTVRTNELLTLLKGL